MTSKSIATLIARLREIQVKTGWDDKQMAERLGCSRQLYQMTRSGKIPVGRKILKGISMAFPELQQDVIYFLAKGADISTIEGDEKSPQMYQEAQGRALKRFCRGLVGWIRRRLEVLERRQNL
jgi:transcriptional regulator with XRE-family HTH domain